MSKTSILIVAGEVSGDMHAASLVRAINDLVPDAHFFGIGGDEMRKAGVEVIYDTRDMAVMGLTEVLRRLPFFKRVFRRMLSLTRERKPSAAILVDYPDFNLRLAARVRKMGVKTIYYICPQVWAWRKSRIPQMAEFVDRLITIFPFEREYFSGTRLRVDFVGHPLVAEAQRSWDAPRTPLPWYGTPHVAILPGSRSHEIQRILPVMWRAAGLLAKRNPRTAFIVASPSREIETTIRNTLACQIGGPARWSIVAGNTRQVLCQATAAMVASGTATIEASLMLCPMVIAYKMARLTYALGRMLVKVDHIGMVNIVGGERVCPELVQNEVTPEALANSVQPLLTDAHVRASTVAKLKRINNALGPCGAENRAAAIVADLLAGS